MLLSKSNIELVNNGSLRSSDVSLELTKRCNLKCSHCYLGEPEEIDMEPEIPDKVFEKIREIAVIYLIGAESTLNPKGLALIDKALGEHKVKFNTMSLVTNGTVLDKEFFEVLQSIYAKSSQGVTIGISNNGFHDAALKQAGITREEVYSNGEKLRKMYPQFMIDDRVARGFGKGNIYASGRAKEFGHVQRPNRNVLATYFCNHHLGGKVMHSSLNNISISTHGNVVNDVTCNKESAKNIFGNVVTDKLSEILKKHAYDSRTHYLAAVEQDSIK